MVGTGSGTAPRLFLFPKTPHARSGVIRSGLQIGKPKPREL